MLSGPTLMAGHGTARRPSKDRADPRDQLSCAERLHHVVVGAELKPEHPIELIAPSGHHDDGDVGAGPDGPTDVVAVNIRQAEVEKNDVGSLRGDGVGAGRDVIHPKPRGFKRSDERSSDRVVVLDEQQPLIHRHTPIVPSDTSDWTHIPPI